MNEFRAYLSLLILSFLLIACSDSEYEETAIPESSANEIETYWQLPDDAEFSVKVTPETEQGIFHILVSVGPSDWSEGPFNGKVSYRTGESSAWKTMTKAGVDNLVTKYQSDTSLRSGSVAIKFKVESSMYKSVELDDWTIQIQ